MKRLSVATGLVRASVLAFFISTLGCTSMTNTKSEREDINWLPGTVIPDAVNAEDAPPHVYHPAPMHSTKGRMQLETFKFWHWFF